MTDIRFQSFEDDELADIWYALGGAAVRHPEHFKPLMDSVATELLDRRGVGLNPWLEQRYRPSASRIHGRTRTPIADLPGDRVDAREVTRG